MNLPRCLARRGTVLAALLLSSCATASPGGGGGGGAAAPEEEPFDAEAEMAAAHEALAEDPADPDAWFRLGVAWQKSGHVSAPDSAHAAFEQALELDPDDVEALVHDGLALEDRKRFEEALERYETAVRVAPDDPLPLVNLGSLLYFHYKRTYEAKTAFTKALEIDPDNENAHFNLGVMFADASMFGEARTEWERVLELAPDSPAGALAKQNLQDIQPLLERLSSNGGEADSSP
jgi:tetratricopeptide (TPR) repeat protein